ncbi:MAG: hypothetical protein ACR2LK_08235 [Solirubrobacteraceae bacterium]
MVVVKVGGVVAGMAAVAGLLGWLLIGLFSAPTLVEAPVAVVGGGARVAAIAERLDARPTLDVTRASSGAAARTLIAERVVDGAYAPLAKSGRVIVASAASVPLARELRTTFRAVDARRGVRTIASDAKPLPADDAAGLTGYLVTLAGVVVAVLGGWLLELLAPSIRRGWKSVLGRIGVLALLSAVTGAVLAGVAALSGIFDEPPFGFFEGVFYEVAGAVALLAFGVATITAFLTSLIGRILGLVAGLAVFVVLGAIATSGGLSAPELLPELWQQAGSALPSRSAIELVRNWAYFDGEAISTPLIVLGGYAAGGLVLMLALSPFRRLPK